MKNEKPSNIDEYTEWLISEHGISKIDLYETYYDSVSTKLKVCLNESYFWNELLGCLPGYEEEYTLKTKYDLFSDNEELKLLRKPYSSFLEKTYRKNVLLNDQWPLSPKNGWILPEKWYSQIKDVIRTTIVVKYLDGVEMIANKIESICEDESYEFDIDFEAREEGYYAVHFCVRQPCEIPSIDWKTHHVGASLEIQITTQLQEVIKKLLHSYYQEYRLQAKTDRKMWQWDYRSEEFATNYLGHILHYIEGMIMEIRGDIVKCCGSTSTQRRLLEPLKQPAQPVPAS